MLAGSQSRGAVPPGFSLSFEGEEPMTKAGSRFAAIAACLVTLAACGGSNQPAAQTDVGITSTEILLGNTNAQSGSASAYGTISYASKAYFDYINNQGGVNGRKINYKTVDDGYDPSKTVPLTKQLVEQDKVFAMFNGLGTQTQTSVRDYLNGQKVPQLFVATGATTWGADYSKNTWTLGWQPAYQAEARIYADDVKKHPTAKVGVLLQNDDYGQDYLKGLTDGLGSSASMIVDKQTYDVTAAAVTSQLSALKSKGVDTLFLFTTPGFTIKALVTITKLGWEPTTIYLNSVSNPLLYMGIAKRSGAALKNLVSVGYSKDPTDPQWAGDAGMKQYKEIIALCSTCKPEDGFNIYGVAVAYTMVDVLKQAGTNMTRKNVVDIAANKLNETNPFLLPGITVKTTSSDHFPISQQQMITYSGTSWTLVGSLVNQRGILK
jgi:branched-chain amino acid transport system substrate-binding protein